MKTMLIILATLGMAAATAAYARTTYGLYNRMYYSDSTYTYDVGFRAGSCGGQEVILGPLVGYETEFQADEYIGYCINGTPYYY